MESWFESSFFYHIYPLGFCGAPKDNDFSSNPVSRLDMIDDPWINHMKYLGINAIYIGPLFESSSHGYDTADYYKVDRRLGTNEILKNLVERLHQNGIRIVVDGVFNHVGRDFWAFKDVLINGSNSRYCNWFEGIDFNNRSQYNDSFSYNAWEGNFNLVKLNLNSNEVKEHIFGAVRSWVEGIGIDGIRLDVAYCINPSFLHELSVYCKNIKSDFWLMGEMIHGDYKKIVSVTMLDSATNYECYKGLYSSHNEKNYFEIAYSLNRQFGDGGIYKNMLLYNFVDNHDVNRIASTLKDTRYLNPLHAILFTMPGIPSIYYGSEWAIEGRKGNNSDYDLRPFINLQEISNNSKHKYLVELISKLAKIRSGSEALKAGNYKQLLVKNEQLVFSRQKNNEVIITAVNLSDKAENIEFNMPFANFGQLYDLLSNETFSFYNNKASIEVRAYGARIMKFHY